MECVLDWSESVSVLFATSLGHVDPEPCFARCFRSSKMVEPVPGMPNVFEHTLRVAPQDIDQMGHVNNVVYLRYAQDAAVAHWYAAATPELVEALVWVVRRHEVDYLKPAFSGDELVARTWVGAVDGATFERFVEIARPGDGASIARVRTVWVALDPKTHRPRRVPATLRPLFVPEISAEPTTETERPV